MNIYGRVDLIFLLHFPRKVMDLEDETILAELPFGIEEEVTSEDYG